MNTEKFEGKWLQIQGDIKKTFGRLTDDDLTAIDGHYDKLVGLLEEKYGMAREEVEKRVDKILH